MSTANPNARDDMAKSYVVFWKNSQPSIKTSHWVPGYTGLHKATALEAAEAELKSLENQVKYVHAKYDKVLELWKTLKEATDD